MPSPVQHGPIGPIKEEEEAQPAETADEDIPLDQWIDFLHCSVDTLSRGSALRIRVRRLLPKEKHEENWVYVPGRAQKMILAGQITRARRSLGLALHKISQKPQGGLVVESVGRDVNNCNIWLIKKAETAVPQKRKKRPAKPEVDTLLPPGYIPRGIWDACLMAIHHFYPNGQHFKARDIAKLACSGKIPLELLPSELRDDVKKKEVQGFAQRLGTRFAQTVANLPAVAGHPIVIQHDVGNICTWSVLVCRALAPIRLEDPRVQKMLRHLYTHSPAEGLLSLDIVVMMHGNSSFYASLPQHFQRSLRAKRPTASVGRLLRELAKQSPGSGDFWIESTSKNTSGRNTWKAHFKG